MIIFSLAALYWPVPAYHTAWTNWLAPYPETPFVSTVAIVLLPEMTAGIDRPSLQWLRLVNVCLLIAVSSYLVAKIPSHASIRGLALLGQHSLQVFSFHVAAFYLLLPASWYVVEQFGSAGFVPFVLCVTACLRTPAALHQKYRNTTIPPVPAQPEPATLLYRA